MSDITMVTPELVTLSKRRLLNLACRLDGAIRTNRDYTVRQDVLMKMRDLEYEHLDPGGLLLEIRKARRLCRYDSQVPGWRVRSYTAQLAVACKSLVDAWPSNDFKSEAHNIYAEHGLGGLHRELAGFNGSGGMFRFEQQLVVGQIVSDVVLEDVRMGTYFLYLPVNVGCLIRPKILCAPMALEWDEGNGYFHPHVDSERYICMGAYGGDIESKMKAYRWEEAFMDCESILRTYNEDSPFTPLHGQRCCDCGYAGDGEGISCDNCGNNSCGECYFYCNSCSLSRCQGCCTGATCAVCDECYCTGCTSSCASCGAELCSTCYEDESDGLVEGHCGDCSDAQVAEQEQEATAS